MPLLLNASAGFALEANATANRATAIVPDVWVSLSDNDELPKDVAHCVVSIDRYTELAAGAITKPGGLVLGPSDDVTRAKPYVDELKLICIDFPVFTDGRGYSHARILRKRFGYTGELRAIGDIRADQLLFMQRTGINTYLFDEAPDEALIAELNTRYKHNYQPSYPLPHPSVHIGQ